MKRIQPVAIFHFKAIRILLFITVEPTKANYLKNIHLAFCLQAGFSVVVLLWSDWKALVQRV